jgi:hypothetical protein
MVADGGEEVAVDPRDRCTTAMLDAAGEEPPAGEISHAVAERRPAELVIVHGVGQQVKGPRMLLAECGNAVRDGLELAGCHDPDGVRLSAAFYGDVFRAPGKAGGEPVDEVGVDDLVDFERELLEAYWERAMEVEPDRLRSAQGKGLRAQAAERLRRLAKTRYFPAKWMLVGNLRQARLYLEDDAVRQEVRRRVEETIDSGTRVVAGHSLGSVVAYELLAAHPEWKIDTFVTLGSPLGHDLFRSRLSGAPGLARLPRPECVRRWVNVADTADVVALRLRLVECAEGPVEDRIVHNGARAHAVAPYLTDRSVGGVICASLH